MWGVDNKNFGTWGNGALEKIEIDLYIRRLISSIRVVVIVIVIVIVIVLMSEM